MAVPAPAAPSGAQPRGVRVWDRLVRLFHWSLVVLFLANQVLTEGDDSLHEWIGYAILGLVAIRVVWGLVGTRHARFSAFPPSLSAARAHLAELLGAADRAHPPALSHNPLGALMVYNLLLTLVLLGLTGWMQTTVAFFGVEWVEETHELLANWALVSAGLHVAGVFIEQARTRVPLVRAMVTGRKPDPGRT